MREMHILPNHYYAIIFAGLANEFHDVVGVAITFYKRSALVPAPRVKA
jgi:hypothetical protein